MYEYIKGTVAEVAPAYAVIDAGGVGYYLHISLETYSAIEHETETRLYVHYVVREDAQLLYGFSTKAERELFRLLISVSGVGGNTARMILSTYSPRELQGIITAGNAVLLRGGSEALRSNLALGSLLSEALAGAGLLSQLGYPELAPLVAKHNEPELGADVDEALVVSVADKLCLGGRRVGISARFRASLDKCRDEEARRAHGRRLEAALESARRINDICGKDVVQI